MAENGSLKGETNQFLATKNYRNKIFKEQTQNTDSVMNMMTPQNT